MSRLIYACVLSIVAAPLFAQAPKTLKDQASYAMGVDFARGLKHLEGNPDVALQAIRDLLTGAKLAMTDEQMSTAIESYHKARLDKIKRDGEAFLAANQKQTGVKVLPSGLQYKVVKAGTGKTPRPTDQVKVHYKGTFINGTVFDSSYDRGQPATFPVQDVIPGWIEALKIMRVGDKWTLFVPPKLAYGEEGFQGIEPNSVLIFDIELLDAAPPPTSALPAGTLRPKTN